MVGRLSLQGRLSAARCQCAGVLRADDIRPYTGFLYLSVGADVLIRPLFTVRYPGRPKAAPTRYLLRRGVGAAFGRPNDGLSGHGRPLGTAAPTIYLLLDHGHIGAIIPYLGEIRKFFFPDPLPRGHHGDAGGIGGQLSGDHPAQAVG